MPQEIADAFGLHPGSLEMIQDDEYVIKTEYCQACDEWARKYAALEARFEECRREVERSGA